MKACLCPPYGVCTGILGSAVRGVTAYRLTAQDSLAGLVITASSCKVPKCGLCLRSDSHDTWPVTDTTSKSKYPPFRLKARPRQSDVCRAECRPANPKRRAQAQRISYRGTVTRAKQPRSLQLQGALLAFSHEYRPKQSNPYPRNNIPFCGFPLRTGFRRVSRERLVDHCPVQDT